MQKNHLVEKDEGKNRTELNIWSSQTQKCVFFMMCRDAGKLECLTAARCGKWFGI